MKVTAFFHGIFFKNQIILRATDNNDLLMIKKMFDSKKAVKKEVNRKFC